MQQNTVDMAQICARFRATPAIISVAVFLLVTHAPGVLTTCAIEPVNGQSIIPSNETIVGGVDFTFVGCFALVDVVIPNSVTLIGQYGFSSCASLISVVVPDSVTEIGLSAFKDDSSLSHVKLSERLVSIGAFAFAICANLTSVIIPNSVTSIGNGAFSYCAGLVSLVLPNLMSVISPFTFSQCSRLSSVSIPDSVTMIGIDAFENCAAMAFVNIPNSVTSIGEFAFNGCTHLEYLAVSQSVTNISTGTFADCPRLASVVIPNTTTVIDSTAFLNCPCGADAYTRGAKLCHCRSGMYCPPPFSIASTVSTMQSTIAWPTTSSSVVVNFSSSTVRPSSQPHHQDHIHTSTHGHTSLYFMPVFTALVCIIMIMLVALAVRAKIARFRRIDNVAKSIRRRVRSSKSAEVHFTSGGFDMGSHFIRHQSCKEDQETIPRMLYMNTNDDDGDFNTDDELIKCDEP